MGSQHREKLVTGSKTNPCVETADAVLFTRSSELKQTVLLAVTLPLFSALGIILYYKVC